VLGNRSLSTLGGLVCPGDVANRNPIDSRRLMHKLNRFSDYDNDNDNDNDGQA